MIESAFRALLVPPVGVPPLLTPGFSPASVARSIGGPGHNGGQIQNTAATAGIPANPSAQELLADPHPRPCGGTGQPRPVMAITIPSTDDVGLFFRAGAKNPIAG